VALSRKEAIMSERRETVLLVEGMTCGACVRHVDEALRALEDVEVVEVRLRDGRVRVRHGAGRSVETMVEALRDAGYESGQAAA
jgi:copper chaperone CopZ